MSVLNFFLPLLVQVRKRSKACRAGLRESDELVSINEQPCGMLSHAQAMELIDSSPGILHIRVKRSEEPNNYTLLLVINHDQPIVIDQEKYHIMYKSKTQV